MAPLRNNRDRHRPNRGQIDHDIMEGLPVRQWRKQTATVSKPQAKEPATMENNLNDRWREYPMPKGSELYPPHSQVLLRAARMGQFNQKSKAAEDDKENGDEEDVEVEADSGYVATRWAPVSKDQEQPEPEFLAKRRKGLPSMRDEVVVPDGNAPPVRKVKVRKVDAEGNASVYEVLASEGVVVEGEIVEADTIMTEVPAPGTVIEGVGVANAEGVVIAAEQPAPTPPRRRPPPPKRKNKGPGRGRKKRSMMAPGIEGVPVGTDENGVPQGEAGTSTHLQVPNGNISGTSGGEDSAVHDGDDGSEDDDDDGEEGEDGEMSGNEGATPTPSRSPSKSQPPPPSHEKPEPLPLQPPSEAHALKVVESTIDDNSMLIDEPVAPTTQAASQLPTPQDQVMTDAPMTEAAETMPPVTTESAQAPVTAPKSISLPPIEALPIPLPQDLPIPDAPVSVPAPPGTLVPPVVLEAVSTHLPSQPPELPVEEQHIIETPAIEPVVKRIQSPVPLEPSVDRLPLAETAVVEEPGAGKIPKPILEDSAQPKHDTAQGPVTPKLSSGEKAEDSGDGPQESQQESPFTEKLPGLATIIPGIPPAPIEPPITTTEPQPQLGAIVENTSPVNDPAPSSEPPPPPEPAPASLPLPKPTDAEVPPLYPREAKIEPLIHPMEAKFGPESEAKLEQTLLQADSDPVSETARTEENPERKKMDAGNEINKQEAVRFQDGEENLLGTLEAHLEKNS